MAKQSLTAKVAILEALLVTAKALLEAEKEETGRLRASLGAARVTHAAEVADLRLRREVALERIEALTWALGLAQYACRQREKELRHKAEGDKLALAD